MNQLMVLTTAAELRAIVSDEVSKAIERAQRTAGECIGIDGMAARYGVHRRTIENWIRRSDKLPPRRAGRKWLLRDVLEWERHNEVPN